MKGSFIPINIPLIIASLPHSLHSLIHKLSTKTAIKNDFHGALPGHGLPPTDKTRSTAAGACAGASLWQVRSLIVQIRAGAAVVMVFLLLMEEIPSNHLGWC